MNRIKRTAVLSVMLNTAVLLYGSFLLRRVFRAAEDDKFLEQEFRDHVDDHGDAEHDIFNRCKIGEPCGEIVAQPHRDRSKNKVVAENLEGILLAALNVNLRLNVKFHSTERIRAIR